MTFPTIPLRRIFKVVNGGTPAQDVAYWNGTIPWATPADFGEHFAAIHQTRRAITRNGAENGSATVPRNSLIVSTRAPIGYISIATEETAFNQGCRGLVPTGTANSKFYGYQLEARREELQSLGLGSTFMELSTNELASFPLYTCSPLEQRHIADFLDAETAHIDRTVATSKRLLEVLDERRTAAVVNQILGGATTGRRSKLPWAEFLPDAWDEVRVGLLARMGSGHTPSRSKPEWWKDCTIPWITTGEVQQVRDDRTEVITHTREKISVLGMRNSSAELHPRGTVVLCRTASAGYSAVMGTDMATSQDFVTWTCGPRLDPYYLLWCLRAMRQDLLGRLAMGSTHKTIYVPDLQMLKIPLPPSVDDQREIVQRIRRNNEKADRLTDKVKGQLDLLAERRRALITAAVTGQFDVSTASGRGVTE
ncbi:restriction endonuclease subunit S [Actinomadura rayongensis]|uniref:Restriction endonuclease subunit S n=1 Tax=Actinomadura rayongensis TaxID=1429076 RepID=A0A6I4W994_9ACTN|nr:restriction endonuclease subunit S [Actinomadura rayongensis]MXQ64845.1 restriction endonuclease subunit S [Actinomadura rayongensis]